MASRSAVFTTEDRRLIKRAMEAPLLEAAHEQRLTQAWRDQRDQAALNELIEAHMRLVIALAAKFRHYGLPMGDLIQEGMVGLMQAAERFDPERLVRFSTYASWWVRAAIQDYVLRNWSIVRAGATSAHKALFFNLRRLRARLEEEPTQQLSRKGAQSIARQLKVPERDVALMAERLSAGDRSLNARIGEDGDAEWMDLLADERALPEDQAMLSRDRETVSAWLDSALRELNEREYRIIRERRLSDETVTLETLGKALGISKERVRQIEHAALKKLRVALEDRAGDRVADLLTAN